MFPHSISTDEINQLPRQYFEGEIFLVDTLAKLQDVIPHLRSCNVLGFDTETRPNFKKGQGNRNSVALLQLSTSEKAFLFRLNKMELPEEIIEILANKKITKIGVAIRDDIRILQKLKPFKADGFVELQEMVKKFEIENFGLKKLAGIVLNIRISKSQRLSDWEADELSIPQQKYAATDAWVCHEIFNILSEKLVISTSEQNSRLI